MQTFNEHGNPDHDGALDKLSEKIREDVATFLHNTHAPGRSIIELRAISEVLQKAICNTISEQIVINQIRQRQERKRSDEGKTS